MPISLDIETLRSLVAIAETGSFSRAAEIVGCTQSAISLRISRMEAVLGHAVIERGRGRMLALTPRGTRLVDDARQMIALNERAVAAARRPEPGRQVRIGMPADVMERNLAQLLGRVRQWHPVARIEVRSDVSAHLAADVRQGRLDLALFRRATGSAASSVAREELRWFRGAGAPLRAVHGASPLPVVAFSEGCAYRAEAERSLGLGGREWFLACEARTFEALVAAVEAGIGYAVLPASLGQRKGFAMVPDLPALDAVELAIDVAERGDMPMLRSIAAIVAEHCAVA